MSVVAVYLAIRHDLRQMVSLGIRVSDDDFTRGNLAPAH